MLSLDRATPSRTAKNRFQSDPIIATFVGGWRVVEVTEHPRAGEIRIEHDLDDIVFFIDPHRKLGGEFCVFGRRTKKADCS